MATRAYRCAWPETGNAFKQYLRTRAGVSNFARHCRATYDFPDVATFEQLHVYLKEQGASRSWIESAQVTWDRFEKWKKDGGLDG